MHSTTPENKKNYSTNQNDAKSKPTGNTHFPALGADYGYLLLIGPLYFVFVTSTHRDCFHGLVSILNKNNSINVHNWYVL